MKTIPKTNKKDILKNEKKNLIRNTPIEKKVRGNGRTGGLQHTYIIVL